MKLTTLILSFTLGLTTTAQAKKLWQCDLIGGEVVRFEDKLVALEKDGTARTFNCNTDNVINKDICVTKVDFDNQSFLFFLIFEPSNKVPSKVSFFHIESEETIDGMGIDELENCKEY